MSEYNATSLWPVSKNSYNDFGIPIPYEKLLLSQSLIARLEGCLSTKIRKKHS